MKATILFFTLFVCVGALRAQLFKGLTLPQIGYDKLSPSQNGKHQYKEKETGSLTKSRLISTLTKQYQMSWDSSHYTYTGAHGYDENGGYPNGGADVEDYFTHDSVQYLPQTGRSTLTFDTNNNVITALTQNLSANGWIDYKKDLYSYDSYGQRTSSIDSIWVNSSSIWSMNEKLNYTYDARGYHLADTDASGYSVIEYYNKLSNITSETSGVSTYTDYQYDGLHILSSDYHSGQNQCVAPNTSTTYSYNPDYTRRYGITTIYIRCSCNDYQNNYLYDTARYDSLGRITFHKQNYTDGGAFSSDSFTYNEYDQYLTTLHFYENNIIYRSNFWYETFQASAPNPIQDSAQTFDKIQSQIYPNPFTKSFVLVFDADQSGDATLTLYDINGRMLTRSVTSVVSGSNHITWDAGYSMPKGIYSYVLSIGNGKSTGKVVVD